MNAFEFILGLVLIVGLVLIAIMYIGFKYGALETKEEKKKGKN